MSVVYHAVIIARLPARDHFSTFIPAEHCTSDDCGPRVCRLKYVKVVRRKAGRTTEWFAGSRKVSCITMLESVVQATRLTRTGDQGHSGYNLGLQRKYVHLAHN